jgi:hypothetical protein
MIARCLISACWRIAGGRLLTYCAGCWDLLDAVMPMCLHHDVLHLSRRWAYFSSTLVYACQRPDRPEHCVTFWQTSSGEKYTKFIKRLAAVAAAGDHCVLAARGESAAEYMIILCNAIGSPVDSR